LLDWKKLFDMALTIRDASQSIGRMNLWSDGVCFDDSTCIGYGSKLDFEMRLEGVPSGPTNIRTLVLGKSGTLELRPATGYVQKVHLGMTSGGADFVKFDLQNVKAKFDWDLDGDTRFPGFPVYFFVDTGGQWMTANFEVKGGEYGVGAVGAVNADNFQLGLKLGKALGFIPYPIVQKVGSMRLCGSPQVYIAGQWWAVPPALLLGC
jgi:hypothetical protein